MNLFIRNRLLMYLRKPLFIKEGFGVISHEVFSGKTQNSPHSLMCEINFKLHSERIGSSRRKSNNQLISMVN